VAVLLGGHCDGCLGERKCWVCLGRGVNERSRGVIVVCHRCFGSGKCQLCGPIQIQDLGQPPELTP